MNEVCSTLDQIRNDQSDETSRRAGLLRAGLQYGRIDDIWIPACTVPDCVPEAGQ